MKMQLTRKTATTSLQSLLVNHSGLCGEDEDTGVGDDVQPVKHDARPRRNLKRGPLQGEAENHGPERQQRFCK
jgi:hypothetical protein